MDVRPGDFRTANINPGSLQHRPIHYSPEFLASEVHGTEARSICCCHRLTSQLVGKSTGVCISPFQSHQMSTQTGEGEVNHPSGGTSMASSIVVSCSAGILNRFPTSPILSTTTSGPIRSAPPPDPVPVSSAGRLEGLRKRMSSEGISEQASELISAGWSRGTNCAYQSAWSQWASWCDQRNINSFSCDVSSFVNFLASLYSRGLQH